MPQRSEPPWGAGAAQQASGQDRTDAVDLTQPGAVLIELHSHLRGVGAQLFVETPDVGNRAPSRCGFSSFMSISHTGWNRPRF
jgi:hypothetical protein